jgi:hypothetical protein
MNYAVVAYIAVTSYPGIDDECALTNADMSFQYTTAHF